MTVRTKEELVTQINTLLPSNNSGAISAADVRSVLIDFTDSGPFGAAETAELVALLRLVGAEEVTQIETAGTTAVGAVQTQQGTSVTAVENQEAVSIAAVEAQETTSINAVATAAGGTTYADTATGLGATASGGYFYVKSTDTESEALIMYLDNAGSAVEQLRTPSAGDTNFLGSGATSYSIADSDGRRVLALGPDGGLVESSIFAAAVASANEMDNTKAAIARLPRHGNQITYVNWPGLTGMGQSNENGSAGGAALTTTQPYSNKKISAGARVDLVEASYEGWRSAAANHASMHINEIVRPWDTFQHDWIVNGFGASGTDLAGIAQGTTPYNSALAGVTTRDSLATAAGKTYEEKALILIHGEDDARDGTAIATYRDGIIQLKDDWNTDVAAITGQTDRIPMFVFQVGMADASSYILGNEDMCIAQQQAAEDDDEVYIVGVGYSMMNAIQETVHYNNYSNRLMGEYIGKALYRYFFDKVNPSTVYPMAATWKNTRTVDVQFYVPVPPLVFDLDFVLPPDAALGFSAYDSGDVAVAIGDVRIIAPDTVRITTSADIAVGGSIGYAIKAYTRAETGGAGPGRQFGGRGNLRDSDRHRALYTDEWGNPYQLPNWCIAFKKTIV